MRNPFKGPAPGTQVEDFYAARGMVWTDQGWVSEQTGPPWILRDFENRYRRVAPDGPYDRAWEGVQKINPIAMLATGYMVIPNPYNRERLRLPNINLNNPTASSIGAGPAVIAMQEQNAAMQRASRPGLLQTVLARLRGG